MNYTVFFDGRGRITHISSSRYENPPENSAEIDTDLTPTEIACQYRVNKERAVVYVGMSPSPLHEWDFATDSWIEDEEKITLHLAQLRRQINDKVVQLMNSPALFDGIMFDADAQSRTAITGLEARIRRGDGLAMPWRGWRTYDNTFVWADATAEQVQQHLLNLQRLLEDRWQALLDVAWAKKDSLSQLKTVEEVIAFDVESGWPDIQVF